MILWSGSQIRVTVGLAFCDVPVLALWTATFSLCPHMIFPVFVCILTSSHKTAVKVD